MSIGEDYHAFCELYADYWKVVVTCAWAAQKGRLAEDLTWACASVAVSFCSGCEDELRDR